VGVKIRDQDWKADRTIKWYSKDKGACNLQSSKQPTGKFATDISPKKKKKLAMLMLRYWILAQRKRNQ